MVDVLAFIFKSFWTFIGFVIILEIGITGIVGLINKILMHFRILKHGWPPPHCDSDGDPVDSPRKKRKKKGEAKNEGESEDS